MSALAACASTPALIASALGVSIMSVQRWRSEHLDPDNRNRNRMTLSGPLAAVLRGAAEGAKIGITYGPGEMLVNVLAEEVALSATRGCSP